MSAFLHEKETLHLKIKSKESGLLLIDGSSLIHYQLLLKSLIILVTIRFLYKIIYIILIKYTVVYIYWSDFLFLKSEGRKKKLNCNS